MKASIISVGTELATGQALDTNSAWLAAALTRVGVHVVEHVTVADEVANLAETLRRAVEHVEIVIITGGLGPTADDLTRNAIAAAIGEPLELNEDALSQIEDFFARWQRPMHEANRVQAMIPRSCRVLPNRRGTAPGIAWLRGERMLFALPGVPDEMKAMFVGSVEPLIAPYVGEARTLGAQLRCFGISEARLGEAIADLMARGRNPSVGTTASGAILTVRVLATADDECAARALLEKDVQEIRKRLGPVAFGEGDDRLQEAVARLLLAQKKTITTAESCTGGLLAKRLTDVPGSSGYFLCGRVAYSNRAKAELLGVKPALIERAGAVSEEIAEAMAVGGMQRASADCCVSITGIAGPGGGSAEKPVGLVYVGLADDAGVSVKRLLLGEHLGREQIRDRSCKAALNWFRLRLLGHE